VSLGIAILGLAVLILIHEAGHFFAARAVGMRPRKFYVGFPPPLVRTTRGGVEYGIGAIPLGGYVKLPGMHRPAPGDLRASLKPEEQEACAAELDALDAALRSDDEDAARAALPALEQAVPGNRTLQELRDQLAPDAYWRQTMWRRVVVIGAGPAVNAVCAIVLFVGVFMVGSVVTTRTIDKVLAGHPAAAAGLKPGDRIVAIAGRPVQPDQISTRINATRGKPFTLVVSRHGQRIAIGPLRAREDAGAYRIGVEIKGKPGPGESLPAAVGDSFRLTGQVISGEATGIAGLFAGHGTKNVSSTVGIVRDTAAAYRASLQDYFFTLGLISLVLAVLNLFPLLPLDGGHIVMSVLEAVRKRAFSQLAYLRYSAVGIALLLFVVSIGLNNDLGLR
jgi:regulator of sigma E protease